VSLPGHHVTFLPAACVHCFLLLAGVLFGDRVVKYHDTIVFADNKNGLR
jgi:hypothetical protein